jgi:hypothetical protein
MNKHILNLLAKLWSKLNDNVKLVFTMLFIDLILLALAMLYYWLYNYFNH